ncbi:MAG TPA: ATPase, partial [Succinivibrio sp.]|nr:ATPase [Succinivibrio sp.]
MVKIFVDTHDIGLVIEKQKDILAQYRQDITKYTLDNKVKVTNIFEQIPAQLDEKNRRFKLSSISKTARLRDYDDA